MRPFRWSEVPAFGVIEDSLRADSMVFMVPVATARSHDRKWKAPGVGTATAAVAAPDWSPKEGVLCLSLRAPKAIRLVVGLESWLFFYSHPW